MPFDDKLLRRRRGRGPWWTIWRRGDPPPLGMPHRHRRGEVRPESQQPAPPAPPVPPTPSPEHPLFGKADPQWVAVAIPGPGGLR